MPALKPKVRDDITVMDIDGEAVIYDERSGDLHHLNRTATVVLGLCDGATTVKEFSSDLADAFGVPVREMERQVRGLIKNLRNEGLLETGWRGDGPIS